MKCQGNINNLPESMEQSRYGKANSFSANEEIPHTAYNINFIIAFYFSLS
jgi:hypothetical protein